MKRDESLFEAGESQVVGGCEFPFVSCTRKFNSMLRASLAKSSTASAAVVLEVSPKLVDRPAALGWLSQYPGEQEMVFPALTGLETSGYRVEEVKEGAVLIIESTPIINYKARPAPVTHAPPPPPADSPGVA